MGLVGLRELRAQVGAAGHAPPVVRHEEVRHRRLHVTQDAGLCLHANLQPLRMLWLSEMGRQFTQPQQPRHVAWPPLSSAGAAGPCS